VAINADKPHLWKQDIAASVDLFNTWFMRFAPEAYRNTREQTTQAVLNALRLTHNLRHITPEVLKGAPEVLQTLRMSTAPPIARDRLVGLACTSKNLVYRMETARALPPRASGSEVARHLRSICSVIDRLLDRDVFPWLDEHEPPSQGTVYRAATIVADRLCGAVADPIIRHAQEQRQLDLIGQYLTGKGYRKEGPPRSAPLTRMQPGTFTFRLNVAVGPEKRRVKIPVDVVIQPHRPKRTRLPVILEAKSAGDFTNVNKRRKEEAQKARQLRETYGEKVQLVLFLCGYFDPGYLGYEASEGIDWVWNTASGTWISLGYEHI